MEGQVNRDHNNNGNRNRNTAQVTSTPATTTTLPSSPPGLLSPSINNRPHRFIRSPSPANGRPGPLPSLLLPLGRANSTPNVRSIIQPSPASTTSSKQQRQSIMQAATTPSSANLSVQTLPSLAEQVSPRSSRESSPSSRHPHHHPRSESSSSSAAAKPHSTSLTSSLSQNQNQAATTNNNNIPTTTPSNANTRLSRSRTNSTEQFKTPIVAPVPSAAAVQRALSAIGSPKLMPGVGSGGGGSEGGGAAVMKGSTSRSHPPMPLLAPSRVKSPPPASSTNASLSRAAPLLSPRKASASSSDASNTPNILASQTSTQRNGMGGLETLEEEGTSLSPGAEHLERFPSRSLPSNLDSVQEIARQQQNPSDSMISSIMSGSISGESRAENVSPPTERSFTDSGTDSTMRMPVPLRPSDATIKGQSATIKPTVKTQRSYSQLSMTKGKIAEGSNPKTMTVETETVTNVPSLVMTNSNVADRVRSETSSLRMRPSVETIRPKKDKKRTVRKTPSISSNNPAAKADIFEARMLDAVGTANSSDSEETYVYESNPQDARTGRRYRPRSPSITSMTSFADAPNHHLTADPSVRVKKSMKFASNSGHYANLGDLDGPDSTGTGRTAPKSHHHHHIGRHGRHPHTGHTSLFDRDSPFPMSPSTRDRHGAGSGTHSPRQPHTPRKNDSLHAFDIDAEAQEVDEQTPLFGNRQPKTPRKKYQDRFGSVSYTRESREWSWFSILRTTNCIALLIFLLLAIVGLITGGWFMSTNKLEGFEVLGIENVLASESELLFDLKVTAMNQNLWDINVDDLEVLVFANSKFASLDVLQSQSQRKTVKILDDPLDDPPLEPTTTMTPTPLPTASQTPAPSPTPVNNLLLGKITHFDTPLIFPGSPLSIPPRHDFVTARGSIKVAMPANRTNERGTERWRNVLKHDFEILVRGQAWYRVPVSGKVVSGDVRATVVVDVDGERKKKKKGKDDGTQTPEDGDDEKDEE